MEGCFFCRVLKERLGMIYEDDHFYGRLDLVPVSPGHAELVSKRHIGSVFELRPEERSSLVDSLQRLIFVVQDLDLITFYNSPPPDYAPDSAPKFFARMQQHPDLGKKPAAYNFGWNQGEVAGQSVPHLHIHVMPRYAGDIPNPRGGVRHIIPDLGNY
jgi:diadenosine tetraphosphate (Ap4A) HIT family hydrolase